jgi:hypothetical protein
MYSKWRLLQITHLRVIVLLIYSKMPPLNMQFNTSMREID